MNVPVNIAVIFRGEGSGTEFAGIRFDSTVRPHMLFAMFRICEGSMANFTFIGSLSCVDTAYVYFKQSPALIALKIFKSSIS